MENLTELYEEVSPKFIKLFEKRDEVAERINKLESDMVAAEKNYDINNMEKLTISLSSSKKVYERIEKDIQKLKEEVNGPNGNRLSNRVDKAFTNDTWSRNSSREVQSKFDEIDKLEKEIEEIKDEMETQAREEHQARREFAREFTEFFADGARLSAGSFSEGYSRIK